MASPCLIEGGHFMPRSADQRYRYFLEMAALVTAWEVFHLGDEQISCFSLSLLRLPSGFQGLLRFCEKNLSWK